ncbi:MULTISPECIES: super-infection exclusion protein B [unclassified Shewanella]|uniref:super-infection exclusion protein B n=1 Tax=unclassified Shewanella TaxID=196818 RepID=UPI0035502F38
MIEFKKMVDWLKLSPKQAFIIFTICSILLFDDGTIVVKLGLEKPKELLQPYLGLMWLLTLALLLSELIIPLYKKITKKYSQKKYLKHCRTHLHNLTVPEKEVLSEFISNNTKSIEASLSDGVIQELATNNIIRLAATVSVHGDFFAYNIQPWAWKYLHKNPELLK